MMRSQQPARFGPEGMAQIEFLGWTENDHLNARIVRKIEPHGSALFPVFESRFAVVSSPNTESVRDRFSQYHFWVWSVPLAESTETVPDVSLLFPLTHFLVAALTYNSPAVRIR
jgi:hypothetical protein